MKKGDIDVDYQLDSEIIEGCRKKKSRFQKQLYFRYCDDLFTTAARILKNRHLAEDALHDAFLQIFHDIKGLRNDHALLSWMRRIVVHTSLKMIQRYKKIEYTDNPIWVEQQYSFNPMEGEQIEKAISLLPEGYRIVFLLVEVEGYKHHEVAEMLGISVGTSKSQLHYAKQSLMKMLKEY